MKKLELKKIFVVLGLVLCMAAFNAVAQEPLTKTPADYEGPFYPVTKQDDIDNNLIQVKGRAGIAKGDILNLSGIVVNTKSEPQPNVVIEIWQTDPDGRYNHPGDSSPGERDPNFQYWGAAVTDESGAYSFKTVVPGAYEPRPAHIHYKVLRDGRVLLTSQIYFLGPDNQNFRASMTSRIEMQTVDLKLDANGQFGAYFRIVI